MPQESLQNKTVKGVGWSDSRQSQLASYPKSTTNIENVLKQITM